MGVSTAAGGGTPTSSTVRAPASEEVLPVAPGGLTILALVPSIVLAVVAGFVLGLVDRRREKQAPPAPPALSEPTADAQSGRRAA